MPSRLMTAKEVAEWWGMTELTIYSYGRHDYIPVVHLGNTTRFDREALEAFLAAGGVIGEKKKRAKAAKEAATAQPKAGK